MTDRPLRHRIHNPQGRRCGCDPDCWCNRTRLGRLVKWWLPARRLGLEHKNTRLAEWKRTRPPGALEHWKRDRDPGVDRIVGHQPKYERLVRLGPMRYGLTVRLANGTTIVHELGGRARFDSRPS